MNNLVSLLSSELNLFIKSIYNINKLIDTILINLLVSRNNEQDLFILKHCLINNHILCILVLYIFRRRPLDLQEMEFDEALWIDFRYLKQRTRNSI